MILTDWYEAIGSSFHLGMDGLSLTMVLLTTLLTSVGASQAAESQPPNVVFIMVDDLGFSDIGCYGSEIETPRLDQLASQGLRFSQFYNTAKCHSSRVALLTGQYCIAAGDTSLSHAVTSAEVLGTADYIILYFGGLLAGSFGALLVTPELAEEVSRPHVVMAQPQIGRAHV